MYKMHMLLYIIDTLISVKRKYVIICLGHVCLCNLKRDNNMPIFELTESGVGEQRFQLFILRLFILVFIPYAFVIFII